MKYGDLKRRYDNVLIDAATYQKINEMSEWAPLLDKPVFQEALISVEKDGRISPIVLESIGLNKYEIYLYSSVQDDMDETEPILGGQIVHVPVVGKTLSYVVGWDKKRDIEPNRLCQAIVFFLEKMHSGLHSGVLKIVQKSFPNYGPSDRYQIRGQMNEDGNWIEPFIENNKLPKEWHKSAVYQIK